MQKKLRPTSRNKYRNGKGYHGVVSTEKMKHRGYQTTMLYQRSPIDLEGVPHERKEADHPYTAQP